MANEEEMVEIREGGGRSILTSQKGLALAGAACFGDRLFCGFDHEFCWRVALWGSLSRRFASNSGSCSFGLIVDAGVDLNFRS